MSQSKRSLSKMERGVRLLLEGMGVDTNDPNFRDTPKRVAKMYNEMFTPRKNNYRSFVDAYDEMVLLRGHEVHGVCPHHLVPVEMRVYLAYLPQGRVLGLSKLARTVESQLTGPVLQESFTDSIVSSLHARIHPKGIACVVVGRHGCMHHRGVRTDADVVTSKMHGVFLLNPTAREEFLRLIGRPT